LSPHSHQRSTHNVKEFNFVTSTQAPTKASPSDISGSAIEAVYRDEQISITGFGGGGNILCASHNVKGIDTFIYTQASTKASPCELIGSATETCHRDERKGPAGFESRRRILCPHSHQRANHNIKGFIPLLHAQVRLAKIIHSANTLALEAMPLVLRWWPTSGNTGCSEIFRGLRQKITK
jgi:hypothetical protein